MPEEKDQAKDQAEAQVEGIRMMIDRFRHANACNGGEDCKMADKEILEGMGLYYEEGRKATDEERETYHDLDEARQNIQDDPLSVEVRSDWHTPGEPDNSGPYEFTILLCTGGPAVRIIGYLDEHAYPERARVEYQDWGTPWTEYFIKDPEDRDAVLLYAQEFYYGE